MFSTFQFSHFNRQFSLIYVLLRETTRNEVELTKMSAFVLNVKNEVETYEIITDFWWSIVNNSKNCKLSRDITRLICKFISSNKYNIACIYFCNKNFGVSVVDVCNQSLFFCFFVFLFYFPKRNKTKQNTYNMSRRIGCMKYLSLKISKKHVTLNILRHWDKLQ